MEKCKEWIEELNKSRQVHYIETDKENEFIGKVAIDKDIEIDLKIVFPAEFPIKLPQFYIKADEIQFLHTDSKGKLCLFDESALLLNLNDPATILLDCQTAHCGRCEQHFIVGAFTSPTVRFGR